MEQKDLLLKDLCARLPYGVMVHYCNKSHTLYTNDFVLNERLLIEFRTPDCCVELKPYLRPMSSMTDEELVEFLEIRGMNINSEELKTFREGQTAIVSTLPLYSRHVDWLNANQFDYRGLIPKGLAIEAPKGMYN